LDTNSKTNLPPHEQAFEWAWQAVGENDWKAASHRWEVLRKAYPEHPATWLQNAVAHIQAGDLEHAEYLLTHARKEFPDHSQTLTESASLAIHRNEWGMAEDYLHQARQKHPDVVQTWLKSSECAERVGEFEKAAEYSERACQCNTDLPDPYIQYAELAMRNNQWEHALERWEKLRHLFPELHVGYIRAADAARQLDRPKEARQLILAQQYGADIIDNDLQNEGIQQEEVSQAQTLQTKNVLKQHNGRTNMTRLLELIWAKAIFNLRSEDHHNYLSYVWWVLEPLIHMAIYYLVFGYLLQRGDENFPVFLITGLIPWMWFAKAVSSSSNSILEGQHLILEVGLPSIVFPMIRLLQATLKQIPVFILLFVFLWIEGFSPGMHWWALLPVIAVQILLTIAFASMVAAVIPFMRDLSYLVPTGLTLLMFLSGIFYDYRIIAPEWQDQFLMNPMAFLLKCYRDIFIDSTVPDMQMLSIWGIVSITACIVLMFAYKRLRYVYPRVILE
jgi:lipopolysaccharide transport system permease protein